MIYSPIRLKQSPSDIFPFDSFPVIHPLLSKSNSNSFFWEIRYLVFALFISVYAISKYDKGSPFCIAACPFPKERNTLPKGVSNRSIHSKSLGRTADINLNTQIPAATHSPCVHAFPKHVFFTHCNVFSAISCT